MPRGGKREGAGAKPKPASEKARRITFTLHPRSIAAIKALAERLGTSQAGVVARAIAELNERQATQCSHEGQ